MTNNEILKADMLDILFEHRNKMYGAYALRRNYTNRLVIALGVALSTMLLFVFLSFIKGSGNSDPDRNKNEGFKLTEYIIPKEEIKESEKPKEQVKQQTAQVDYQKIIIVPNEQADPVQPEIDDIKTSDIGNENRDGEPSKGLADTTTKTSGNGAATKEPEEQPEPELPSRPPSFPGGTEKWLEFLQRYLQAPESLEPGQRLEVQVKFWIDVDGSISRPEIIKSGGSSFDKEVLRVLKKMPRWEPAMQKGNFVAVAYTQPVIFIGVEE